MKALVRIGLVAALCMTGAAVFGQEPITAKKAEKPKVHTEKPGSRSTTPASKPSKKVNPATTTRAKSVEPAKKIDSAPTE